jgi:hypothetical protein
MMRGVGAVLVIGVSTVQAIKVPVPVNQRKWRISEEKLAK